MARLGRASLAVRCDVTQHDEVISMVESAVQRFGRLDVLFNDAGIATPSPAPYAFDVDSWRKVIDVDLNGVFYCAREARRCG